MTREEFSNIAKGMKSIYANQNFMPDKDAFDVWFMLLKEYSYKQVSIATKTYMTTEKFPPLPADIINKINDINESASELSENEAWALVRKALSNSTYSAEKEFAKLPETIQKCVGSASNLRAMGQNEDYNEDVEKSLFLKSYRTQVEREKNIARMPQEVRTAIEQKRNEQLRIEGE